MEFAPKDPDWQARVRASFSAQKFMAHLGAELVHLAPGAVDLELKLRPEVTQQHGFPCGRNNLDRRQRGRLCGSQPVRCRDRRADQ
ncbi:PaaI family thioesterase [Roseibium salinum]|uniref:PaaI family thioesterase n=1 Tax=Roseibium salinum TaxID=1604349 RepID=UPI003606BFEB